MDGIDRCAQAEENNCAPAVVEEETPVQAISEETAWLQEPLSSIIANQEIIYNYLPESIANLNQSIANLQNLNYVSQEVEEHVIDEREQQRLQLQAQIDALQNEMANLY